MVRQGLVRLGSAFVGFLLLLAPKSAPIYCSAFECQTFKTATLIGESWVPPSTEEPTTEEITTEEPTTWEEPTSEVVPEPSTEAPTETPTEAPVEVPTEEPVPASPPTSYIGLYHLGMGAISSLPDEEQACAMELYYQICAGASGWYETENVVYSPASMYAVMDALNTDLFYYTLGYKQIPYGSYECVALDEEQYGIRLDLTGLSELADVNQSYEDNINAIASSCCGQGEYDTASALYFALCQYGYDYSYESYLGPDLFRTGVGTCYAFSQAYVDLASACGMSCTQVISEPMNHAWNQIMIGNCPYYVDLTFRYGPSLTLWEDHY